MGSPKRINLVTGLLRFQFDIPFIYVTNAKLGCRYIKNGQLERRAWFDR